MDAKPAFARSGTLSGWLAAALLLAAAALSGPATAQPQPAQGKLLVATTDVGNDSWAETVMLVLYHDSNGSLGVAINRPTFVSPAEVEPEIGALQGYDGDVFRGGPLAPTRMIFLVRNAPPGLIEAPPIVDGIYAGGDLALLPRLAEAVDGAHDLRLYAGHAEWAPGQLEREIADGRWMVVDGAAEHVFSTEPERLWERLVESGDELLVGNPLSRSPRESL